MPEKKSDYKIQNIVATTSLEKPVPLTKLARTQSNTEYDPNTFPGLVLRVKEPKSAVLVFSSGKLVCNGHEVGFSGKAGHRSGDKTTQENQRQRNDKTESHRPEHCRLGHD